MQPYERIGLVALMFLVVILAVGALWDDGSKEDAVLAAERPAVARVDEEASARAAAEEARNERLRAARARLAEDSEPTRSESRRGAARSLRMGGQDELKSRVNRVTTVSAGSDHRSDPLGAGGGLASPAKAQSADELADFARPSSSRSRPTLAPRTGETVSMNQRSTRRRAPEEAPTARAARSQDRGTGAGASQRVHSVAAAGEPERKPSQKAATYTVQSGDVLQRIAAAKLGDSGRSAEIAALNGLSDPDMIRVGMVLTLPPKISASANESTRVAASAGRDAGGNASGGRSYTVKSGESLSLALTRELGTYKRSIKLVQALNPGLNPDRVFAGQVIKLPRLEDIPADPNGKAKRKSSPRSGSPALDTSPGSSRVASAERSAPARSKSVRSDDEFVVR